jgi:hypothetical protein
MMNPPKMFAARQNQAHHHQRPIKAAAVPELVRINLLKALLVMALVTNGYHDLMVRHANKESIQSLQVAASKSKGVIYNKDGKFIFRPSRSSQTHIIIIDDRAPKGQKTEEASKATTNNQSDHYATTASDVTVSQSPLVHLLAASQPARHQQVVASRAAGNGGQMKAFYTNGAQQFQLINLNDFQAGAVGQTNGRAVASTAIAPTNLPPPPQANLANYQMLPIIQMVPSSQSARTMQASQPPLDIYNSPFAMAAAQQAPMNFETANDQSELFSQAQHQQQHQQQRPPPSSENLDQAPSPYYQMAGRHRQPILFGEAPIGLHGAGAGPYDQQQSQLGSPHSRSEPAEMFPFDEPIHPSMMVRSSPVNTFQAQQQALAKSLRGAVPVGLPAATPVRDLDDMEGDHVEYYATDSRDRNNRHAMGGGGGSSGRHYMRPPIHQSPTSGMMDDGSMALAGESHNAHRSPPSSPTIASASNQSHTTQLGSIQGIKSQLKRSNSTPSVVKSKPRRPGAPLRDEDPAGVANDHAGAGAGAVLKEPKSLQYWKQYQDQFDIM